MKKVMFLMAVAGIFAFAACNKISGLDEFDLRSIEVHDTTTLVVHDTTRVVVRDTTVVHDTVHQTDTVRINELDTVIVHDTVFRPDTVIVGGDTVVRWDTIVSHDTTVVDRLRTTATRHLSWDGVSLNGSQLWLAGTDRLVVSVIENGNTVQNDSTTYHHRSRFAYSGISGNTFPSSVSGNTYRLVGGTVVVGGNTITTSWLNDEIIEPSVVIRGTNYRGMLHACHGTAIYWAFSNGTATCHFEDAYGNAAGTYNTTYNTDTPTRRLVSADTTYQHLSTNATGVWSAVASTMTWCCSNRRTITRHYNMAPLTETDSYNFTIGFPYGVTVSGSAQTSMLGTTVNINSGVANFGGGFTVTFTAQPRTCVLSPIPLPCQHQLLTATLTSNGVVVNGTLEGTATTGTVPVSILPPTPPIFSSVLAAAATDSYTHQIYSQASYRHTYVCVVAQIGTNYRFYWADLATNMVRADFDSVNITSTEANFYINHLSDGYYPAMVYDHNNHTSLYRGVVTSVELGTGWQQTYRLAPSNSLAYVMGGSSWTMAGDNGRSAVRGVMNASGQILADGITVQLY